MDEVKDINVPTNDLISRQAAIDAIPQRLKGLGGESWMITYRRSGYNDCVDSCLDALRHLPSVQSEITNEEIRFALKQLGAYFSIKIRDKKEGDVPVELLQQVEKIQEYIGNLPSIEPEIIYCGECKYMMPNGRCSVFADPSIRPSASDYCSSAERRQDVEDSKETPSAEPELKHGRWIKNGGRHGWHCSKCRQDNYYAYAWSSETGNEPVLEPVLQDYYCPNCGAKMDEDK